MVKPVSPVTKGLMRKVAERIPLSAAPILPATPCKERIMFYEASAYHGSQTRLFRLRALLLTPWHMLEQLLTARITRAELARLDDYMLKDIGLSRGSIDSAIRNGAIAPATPTPSRSSTPIS